MCPRTSFLGVILLTVCACQSEAPATAPPDASAGDGPTSGLEVGTCPGPLADAGFYSLADLPIARLCAESYRNNVNEAKTPCEGTIWVVMETGVDCNVWWLFDSTTGDLKASGGPICARATSLACTGAVPGFQLPAQCFAVDAPYQPFQALCPNQGAFDDAATD